MTQTKSRADEFRYEGCKAGYNDKIKETRFIKLLRFITSFCGFLGKRTYVKKLWGHYVLERLDPMEIFYSRHTFFHDHIYGLMWSSSVKL